MVMIIIIISKYIYIAQDCEKAANVSMMKMMMVVAAVMMMIMMVLVEAAVMMMMMMTTMTMTFRTQLFIYCITSVLLPLVRHPRHKNYKERL